MFRCSEVTVLTVLKTSNILHYATMLGNQNSDDKVVVTGSFHLTLITTDSSTDRVMSAESNTSERTVQLITWLCFL